MTPRRRVAGSPVTKPNFVMLKRWVDQYVAGRAESGKFPEEEVDTDQRGSSFLEKIAASARWPDDEDEEVNVASAFEGWEPETAKPRASHARKLLALASKAVGFDKTAGLVQRGERWLLRWKEEKGKEGPSYFQRVSCFWNVGTGAFMNDFLRGMDAMADALGVRFESVPVRADDVDGMINAVKAHVTKQGLKPKTDALILDLVDPNIAETRLRNLGQGRTSSKERFHVVTTGYVGSAVGQDNVRIAELVAEAITADLEKDTSPSPIVLVAKTGGYSGGPGANQAATLQVLLVEGGAQVETLDCQLTIDSEGRVDDRQAGERLKRRLKGKDASRIRAIVVTTSSELAAVVVEVVRSVGKAVPVYATDLSGGTLALLRQKDTPLRLAVGNDPFHYGRLVLLTASVRGEQSVPPPAPVVVTREDVQAADPPLASMCDLARAKSKEDIKLEGCCDYGWFGRARHRRSGLGR